VEGVANQESNQQPESRTLRHPRSRYQPQVCEYYERLQKRGKNKPQALLAVARKLLHAIYGKFLTLQPFDGTRLFAFASPKTA
jgi:transposase